MPGFEFQLLSHLSVQTDLGSTTYPFKASVSLSINREDNDNDVDEDDACS